MKDGRRMSLTPEERTLRARLAAHASWKKTENPLARTAPARAAWFRRFENAVDPDRVLSAEERHRRALHAMQEHMARMAFAAAKARRERAA